MALVYCCSLDGLIASIVLLICTSLWIKASAKWLNVNVNANRSVENEEACFFVFSMIWNQSHKSCGCRKTFISMSVKSMVITVLSKLRPICIYVCVCVCVWVGVEIAPIQKCLQGCGGEYDWLTFLAYQNGRLDSVIYQELRILFFFPLLFVAIFESWMVLDPHRSQENCFAPILGYLISTSFTDLKYNWHEWANCWSKLPSAAVNDVFL